MNKPEGDLQKHMCGVCGNRNFKHFVQLGKSVWQLLGTYNSFMVNYPSIFGPNFT